VRAREVEVSGRQWTIAIGVVLLGLVAGVLLRPRSAPPIAQRDMPRVSRPSLPPPQAPPEVPQPVPPPPHAQPPARLSEGEALHIPLLQGGVATGTLWLAARPGMPLVVALAGLDEHAEGWLPVLKALKAQREVSLAVIDGAPLDGTSVAQQRQATRARLEAVVKFLRARALLQDVPLALLGSKDAGVAALLFASQDLDVRAVAALSPPLDPQDAAEREAVHSLTRRQVFMAVAGADVTADATLDLLKVLPNLRLATLPGQRHGLALLEGTLPGDLAGWLYAALGPAR
jgi:hypothetical protein